MREFIIRGQLQIDGVNDLLQKVPHNGSITVEVRKTKKGRSNAQNALMWKWLTYIGSSLGYNKVEVHDIMCEMILGTKTITRFDGTEMEIPNGTKGLKVADMAAFLNEVDRIASEQGIILPHPEDLYYEAMGYEQA